MSTTLIVVVVAILIFVIIPIGLAVYRSWKRPKAWDELEERRHLDVEGQDGDGSTTRLAGTVRSKDVEVWMDSEIAAEGKSGPPHAQYTNVEVPLKFIDDSQICIKTSGITPSLWRKILTGPGGFEHKSDEVAGGKKTDVDGDAFDADFDVAGNLTEALRRALKTSASRALLDALLKPDSELHIEEGTLRYTQPGQVYQTQRLKDLVDDIVDIALHLDDIFAREQLPPRDDVDEHEPSSTDLSA